MRVQYIGSDYTLVRLEDGAEKVKVANGEIIDVSDTLGASLLSNSFQDVTVSVEVFEDGDSAVNISLEKAKKGKK